MSNQQADQYCESIIPGHVPVNKIYESDSVLAFYAREPLWPVHAIVIPKQHIASLLDFEDLRSEVIADLMKTIANVAKQISAKYGKCRVMTNVGEYQHTKHLHWHIYSETNS